MRIPGVSVDNEIAALKKLKEIAHVLSKKYSGSYEVKRWKLLLEWHDEVEGERCINESEEHAQNKDFREKSMHMYCIVVDVWRHWEIRW